MYSEEKITFVLTILRRLEHLVNKKYQSYSLNISTLEDVGDSNCMSDESLLRGFPYEGDFFIIYASFSKREIDTPLFIFTMGNTSCEVVNNVNVSKMKKVENGYLLIMHFAGIIGKELIGVPDSCMPEE